MSESELEAWKCALKFSNLTFYEDYNKAAFPASGILDLIDETRQRLGEKIDYESLKVEEWDTPEKRMGFALLISNGSSPFSDSGIKEFARYCCEVKDQKAFDCMIWVVKDMQDEL